MLNRNNDISAHHQRGLALLGAGSPGPALTELELALGQDPGSHEILKNLGNAHKALGDIERAVERYRQSLKLAPDHPPSLYNLGLAFHEMNRLEEAEETFATVSRSSPTPTGPTTAARCGCVCGVRSTASRMLALSLAREPGRLAALRGKLARDKDTASLFDTPRFTRNLEAAYEIMWRHYLAGGAPRAIEL